jgi:hypothetical protein
MRCATWPFDLWKTPLFMKLNLEKWQNWLTNGSWNPLDFRLLVTMESKV